MTPPIRGGRGRGRGRICRGRSKPAEPSVNDEASPKLSKPLLKPLESSSPAQSTTNNNVNKRLPRNSSQMQKQKQKPSNEIAKLREELLTCNERITYALSDAAALARQSRGELSTLVIVTWDAFREQQELLKKLEEAAFPEVHEVRDDQVCIIQPKIREAQQEAFVETLLEAVEMEFSSVVKIYRDRRKDFLIVRFSSKILVHEFLRRFRERNQFKMLGGARLTRDMNPEELEKYWRSVEQVSALNKAGHGDRVFYVDLITLEVCKKETAMIPELTTPAPKTKSSKSTETKTITCMKSDYEGRPTLKMEYPKSEGDYYEDDGEIALLERDDLEAKRFNHRKLDDPSSFINAQRRITFDRIPKSSETLDLMLLHFKQQRSWLHSVKKICYDANFVCHVDDLVRIAATPAKDTDYSWKIYVTKMENVLFLKTADFSGIDFTEKSHECNFKDAITLSKRNKSGLVHRMISTKIVEMPGCPMDVLVFSDEDCVAKETRNGENSFILLKTRPKDKPFDDTFYRTHAVDWYFRTLFGGIDKIIVGLRDKNNRIYETRSVNREDLSGRDWDPSVCLHFLNDVLLKVKALVGEGTDLRTFIIERRRGENQVRVERDPDGHRFLPSSFVGAMLKKTS